MTFKISDPKLAFTQSQRIYKFIPIIFGKDNTNPGYESAEANVEKMTQPNCGKIAFLQIISRCLEQEGNLVP